MSRYFSSLALLADKINAQHICGIDIETTAIDEVTKDIEKIWCISWSLPNREVKSLHWKNGITKAELSNLFANASTQSVLAKESVDKANLLELRSILLCETVYVPAFHSAQFDKRHLSDCGLNIPYYHCTQIMGYVLIPPATLGSTGEEDAMRFYRLSAWGMRGFCSAKMSYDDGWDAFSDEMLRYNQGDAIACRELAENLWNIVIKDELLKNAYIIDMCAQEILIESLKVGVHVDEAALHDLLISKESELRKVQERIFELVPAVGTKKKVLTTKPLRVTSASPNGIYDSSKIGCHIPILRDRDHVTYLVVEQFNPGSSIHMQVALTALCNWVPQKFSKKTGKPSTDSSVLNELANDYEFASLILRQRELSKLISTYLTPFKKTDVFGRIHPTFLLTATRTSRLASRSPNFQNIPKNDVPSLIRATDDGHVIVSIDLSQIELRILAWYLVSLMKDKHSTATYLWELYEQKADVHAANQQFMELDERRQAKIAIFLWIYGGGAYRMSDSLGISLAKAENAIKSFESKLPVMPAFKREVWKMVRKNKVIRTLYGHKIHYPNFWSKTRYFRLEAERQYVNAIIQGSQSDIMKILMHSCTKVMLRTGAVLIMQIHDELVFEVPIANAPILCDELYKIFNNRKLLPGLMIEAVPGVGSTWAEAKKDSSRREDALKDKKNKAEALRF